MADLRQIEAALRAADAAGNVEDARRLAQAYAAARSQQPKADFSGVTSTAETFPDGQPSAVPDTLRQIGGMAAKLNPGNLPASLYGALTEKAAEPDAPGAMVGGESSETMPAWKNAAYGLVSPVASGIVGVGQMTGAMDDQQAQESLARIDAVRSRTPGKVAGIAGDIGMLALPVSKIGQLSNIGKYAGNAAIGAGYGGLQGVREGESRGQNAAIGGALGAGGQALSHGLSTLGMRAAGAIDPLKKKLAGVAAKYDIPLHASQLSDSLPAKVMASAGKYLPFSGAGAAAKKQQEAFNAALGQTIGVNGATKLTDDVLRSAKRDIGKTYDDIFDRNDVALDKALIEKLAQIKADLPLAMDREKADVVVRNIDYIMENSKAGKLPGRVYQSLRERLKGDGDKVGEHLKKVRSALDDAAGRSVGPQDAAALKQANSQWANARTIQDALKQAGGAAENVAPANLWNLVKKGSTKELRELARVGQVLLKDPIPDSGTAQRSLLYTMLAGGAATGALPLMLKSAAAGATLGRVANSPRLADLMLRSGRGQGAQALAPYARPAAALGPVVSDQHRNDPRNRP
ncbi:hypothetical protein IP90_00936 [Luteimonas cucumeris]|uniref:Uncharacterized protein n=1 Tax=Luteimonas cucumeris TaxID=985012 RepID=A0A562LB15_9GAMM|nr:hypothetical protein [Luteimonas cucumeris]TWI04798.1 hypothetical protein IP90_00936 [Luteimonas cucumeris]